MNTPLSIRVEDGEQLADLETWFGGHTGIYVARVNGKSAPNAQGSVWDFLTVVCGSGGALTAAVRALQLWIEARVTVVHITAGGKTFTVHTSDVRTMMPVVEAAARALEPGSPPGGGDA